MTLETRSALNVVAQLTKFTLDIREQGVLSGFIFPDE